MSKLSILIAALAAMQSSIAFAAVESADAESTAKLACDGQVGTKISTEMLAEAILLGSKVPASRILATLAARDQGRDAYLKKARSLVLDPSELGIEAATRTLTSTDNFIQAYRAGSLSKLIAIDGVPAPSLDRSALFSSNSAASVSCLRAASASAAGGTGSPSGASSPNTGDNRWQIRLVLRKSVDDLAKASDAGIEGAGSFSLGFTRTKSNTDEGARKRDTDLQINGAVGVAIGKSSAGSNNRYLYAEYTRSEKRSRLNPPPADPPAEGEDDIDVLEVGFAAPSLLTFDSFQEQLFWEVRGRTGWVVDFAKNSRRVYGNLQVEPGFRLGRFGDTIGFGFFGRDLSLGFTSFRLRSRAWAEVELSHVMKAGDSKLNSGDELLGLGGAVRFDLAPKLFAKHGPLGSVQYRRLWMVSGTADDLKRWDIEAGYRFLVGSRLAIDLKTSYALGEERKSYDDEDIWKIEFGLKL